MNVDANLTDPQRWNRYAYAGNNPLRFIDADGMDSGDGPTPQMFDPNSLANFGQAFGDWIDDAYAANPEWSDADGIGVSYPCGNLPGVEGQAKNPKSTNTAQQNAFFDTMVPLATQLAKEWNTDANFILALSAWESGWLNDHNRGLHNPYGLTKAGGNNLNFATFQAATDYWSKNDGNYIEGTTDIRTFLLDLKEKGGYNSADDNWLEGAMSVYSSVLTRRAIWEGK